VGALNLKGTQWQTRHSHTCGHRIGVCRTERHYMQHNSPLGQPAPMKNLLYTSPPVGVRSLLDDSSACRCCSSDRFHLSPPHRAIAFVISTMDGMRTEGG